MSYRSKFIGTSGDIRASYPKEWQIPHIYDRRFESIRHGNIYSQFGEDGLIGGILSTIGTKFKRCFEIGASDGEFFSNTKALRDFGWSALLIEADSGDFEALYSRYNTKKVECVLCEISTNNVNEMIFGDFDLGVIDIDSEDLSVWKAMISRPRILVVETGIGWGTNQDGACLEDFRTVAREKKYTLVATTYCNAIFVSNEALEEVFPEKIEPRKIIGIMSVPRVIFSGTTSSIDAAFFSLGIPVREFGGAYWEQCVQANLEKAIEDGYTEAIVLDYDSIFSVEQFQFMVSRWYANPWIDALSCMQPQRGTGQAMFSHENGGKSGQMKLRPSKVPSFKARTAHFGLTFLRLDKLAKMPKPWFWSQPSPIELPNELVEFWTPGLSEALNKYIGLQILNPGERSKDSGCWRRDDTTDADIFFWRRWEATGMNLYVLPEVLLGHLEEVVARMNPETGDVVHFYQSEGFGDQFGMPIKVEKKEECNLTSSEMT